MSVTLPALVLTDAENAAIVAEIGEQGLTVAQYVEDATRAMVLTPAVDRQRQYALAAAQTELAGLIDKIIRLTPEQQTTVREQIETAVDGLLA
jgi:hypothetical protein